MGRLLMIAMVVVVAGCASQGIRVDEAQVIQFQPGTTTYYEVVAKLGKPTVATRGTDGTRQVIYSYSQMQGNACAYIPFARRFCGAGLSEGTVATLYFDQADKYVTSSFTESANQTNDGWLKGGRQ